MSNLFFYTFRATFISCCVLVHQWLPGAVSHVIFSEMCLLFSVFFFCFAFSQHFVCLSCCISIFLPLLSPLHDDGCSFANHELSPVPHPLGDPLSTPSALFPVVVTYFLLPLSILFPLFVPPSPSPLASIWWWMSLHQLLVSEGLSGLWCQRTQRTVGQAKPSQRGAH